MKKNLDTNGKTTYIAISDNYAIRIKAYSKPKAIIRAAIIFSQEIKNWNPQHGGIVEKSNKKEVRQYLSEHKDITWFNGGAPVDG